MYTAPGVCSTAISFLAFSKLNQSLDGGDFIAAPPKYAGVKRCKWRNVVGSFVHATVVSVLACICAYTTPEYITERLTTTTTLGEITMGIFAGYIVYDAVDLWRYQGFRSTWPILLHHAVLFGVGAGPFLYHHRLIGYGMFAGFAEVNSIFLHGRMLMLMYGVSKASLIYRVNNILNLCTYVTLRLCNIIQLIPLVCEDCEFNSSYWCYWLLLTIITILLINAVLFYRLLKSDFLSFRKTQLHTNSDLMVENYNMNEKSQ